MCTMHVRMLNLLNLLIGDILRGNYPFKIPRFILRDTEGSHRQIITIQRNNDSFSKNTKIESFPSQFKGLKKTLNIILQRRLNICFLYLQTFLPLKLLAVHLRVRYGRVTLDFVTSILTSIFFDFVLRKHFACSFIMITIMKYTAI